uniref:Uncharacterized protein n=1 Tax=Oryza rufipogon TaxID=4529 RepID=A0A0E0QJ63_ORYRU
MAPPRVTAESTPRTRATSHPHPRPRPLPRSPNPNPNLPSSLHDSPPHADSSSPRAAPALPSPLTGKRRALIPPQVVYTDESVRPIPEEVYPNKLFLVFSLFILGVSFTCMSVQIESGAMLTYGASFEI